MSGEKGYGKYITDEASAKAWSAEKLADARELSERAKDIEPEASLSAAELTRIRNLAISSGVPDPDNFLRTRILRFSETPDDDPFKQKGLVEFIEQDLGYFEGFGPT